MNKFALVLAGSLVATAAVAQTTAPTTTTPSTTGTPPAVTTMPSTTMPSAAMPRATTAAPPATTATGVAPSTGLVDRNTGTAAAAGNRNQAVTTTNANALQPAKGANSFTMGEARRRLTRQGFTQVAGLKKDGDGIWRGEAMKAGAKTAVWLDYKGNIGQQ